MRRLVLLGALLCVGPVLGGQSAERITTAGIGEVTTVESKAKQIADARVALERQKADIADVQSRWDARIRELEAELAELTRQRDTHIHDLKFGLICSECKRTKTELEKAGINFQEHLRSVKGRALPAPASELEQLRSSYSQKLAVKRVTLQRSRAQADTAIAVKKRDVANREAQIAKWCAEMAAHGDAHEEKVYAEAKATQKQWARDLIENVAAVLIARDKVAIYAAREKAIEAEFLENSKLAQEKLKEDAERQEQTHRDAIAAINADVLAAKNTTDEALGDRDAEARDIARRLAEIETELTNDALTADARTALNTEKAKLEGQATSVATARDEASARQLAKVNASTVEVRRHEAAIFKLRTDLSALQAKAVADLRRIANEQKAQTRAAGVGAAKAMADAEQALRNRESYYQRRLGIYMAAALDEAQRMLIACRPIGCPISSDGNFKAGGNWSQLKSCVTGHTLSKPHNSNVFNAYCGDDLNTVDMLGTYRTFLAGLNPADFAAAKAGSNANWFREVSGQP